MGLTLTATQIAAKNSLFDPNAWILLAEFGITHIKTLGFDSQSSNYVLGDIVRGSTSNAHARVIGMTDAGTSGTLTLWNVVGTFQDNESLLGDAQGVALVNGAIGTDNRTLRYARAKANVTWGGYTWTATSMELGDVEKSTDGSWSDLPFQIFNDTTMSKYMEDCLGLEGETVTLRIVYSGNLTEAAIFTEVFSIAAGAASSAEWLQFSLGMEKVLTSAYPNMRYETSVCRFKFKDSLTCQYAGATTTCDHKLSTCVGLSNVVHIGMFPGIPGGVVA